MAEYEEQCAQLGPLAPAAHSQAVTVMRYMKALEWRRDLYLLRTQRMTAMSALRTTRCGCFWNAK